MLWERLATTSTAAAAALSLAPRRLSFAQRPDDQSICDYYASELYGSSNTTAQLRLIQGIVTLAYAGGSSVDGALGQNTGIFNEGYYNGYSVYLRPWFDGTKKSTNFNNQPVGVDWLDGGGTDRLLDFLDGSDESLDIDQDSNQYKLFTHWFTAFGYVYGCSGVRDFPKPPSSSDNGGGKRLSVAYVHKFMDLNSTHVGYFINQLTVASRYFGFSDADARTLETRMNDQYNVRCAPAEDSGQLYSICQADECPLAQPKADCAAYEDLGPWGAGGGNSSSSGGADGGGGSGSGGASSSSASASATDSGPGASATAADSDSGGSNSNSDGGGGDDSGLSGGAIAGIVIGAAAVALLAVGLWLWHRRHTRQPTAIPVPAQSSGHLSPAGPSHVSYSPNPHHSFSPSSAAGHDSFSGGFGTVPVYWQEHQQQPSQSPGLQELGDNEVARVEAAGSPVVGQQEMQEAERRAPDWTPPPGFGNPRSM